MEILPVSVLGSTVHLMTNFQRAATLMRNYPQNPPRPWTEEPSMTQAVPQTPPKNHTVLPLPPPKRPKRPAAIVFKPTENGWEEVPAPKVSAKKVKYGQAKLKRKTE